MNDTGDFQFRPDRAKHAQLAEVLRTRIRSGQIQPRMPLPSELRLQEEFGVARDTVRKAIAALREAGYVRTEMGLGTFVMDRENWPADD